jgi:hypothetical protein
LDVSLLQVVGAATNRIGETMSEDFRQSVRRVALARAQRDKDTGISPPDNILPRQRHWQELHRLSRKFDIDTRPLLEQVVQQANIELGPHGFRIQPTRIVRRLPGEANGVAYLVASETGIEPSGTLTFKLRDSGRVRIEAEGMQLSIHFEGADHKGLEMPLDELQRAHVEAAFLSFVREVLDGAQHAFSDD